MRTQIRLVACLPLALLPCITRAEAPPDIDMLWAQKIPLRDGVQLNATIFKPAKTATPLPVIFTLTPYISDTYQNRASYFAAHGYVYALVDVRGRGNSEGKFEPFENEGRDGADVVEWLARQPFSNGKVGMWGGSYAGFDQWTTLKEFPPHLTTIAPAAAAAAAIDFPFENGITVPYLVQWATYTAARTPNFNLFLDQAFWISKFWRLYSEHAAFRGFDQLAGMPSEWFQKVLQHPTDDAYWQAMRPTPKDYARISIPILTITGHYDDDQPGALYYYRSHMTYGSPEAKAKHFLLIGPWDHAGTRTNKKDVGGLTFADSAILDMNDINRQWYDWTLKGGARPDFLKKRVTNYVVGKDEWVYADTLEELTPKTETFHLASGNGGVFQSGLMRKGPGEGSDTFVYDPLDTRPGEAERREILDYITDQHLPLGIKGDGLVYHSEPFASDTVITGSVSFTAFLRMDVPDTDLEARLYVIEPDGRSVLLTTDAQRTRYRESHEQEHLVAPGEILEYHFRSFPLFSRLVRKGSRLRLLLHCPNTIFAQKNYNSGGVVADETAASARTAHITLYHDAEHPTALTIPVGRE